MVHGQIRHAPFHANMHDIWVQINQTKPIDDGISDLTFVIKKITEFTREAGIPTRTGLTKPSKIYTYVGM